MPLACWLAGLLAAVPSNSRLLYVTAAGLTDALLPGVCRLVLLLLQRPRQRLLLLVRWWLHGVQGLLLLLVLLL